MLPELPPSGRHRVLAGHSRSTRRKGTTGSHCELGVLAYSYSLTAGPGRLNHQRSIVWPAAVARVTARLVRFQRVLGRFGGRSACSAGSVSSFPTTRPSPAAAVGINAPRILEEKPACGGGGDRGCRGRFRAGGRGSDESRAPGLQQVRLRLIRIAGSPSPRSQEPVHSIVKERFFQTA